MGKGTLDVEDACLWPRPHFGVGTCITGIGGGSGCLRALLVGGLRINVGTHGVMRIGFGVGGIFDEAPRL